MKVGIVGSGLVGSTAACTMALAGSASEIVLTNLVRRWPRAQAEDILHATPFAKPVRLAAGDYPQLEGAAVVILACGVGQRPGGFRLQLVSAGMPPFCPGSRSPGAGIRPGSDPAGRLQSCRCDHPDSHPDFSIAMQPGHRPGTVLDTARFGPCWENLEVAPVSVHAYVLGEHGDSEVLVWSSADVGGVPIRDFAGQGN